MKGNESESCAGRKWRLKKKPALIVTGNPLKFFIMYKQQNKSVSMCVWQKATWMIREHSDITH